MAVGEVVNRALVVCISGRAAMLLLLYCYGSIGLHIFACVPWLHAYRQAAAAAAPDVGATCGSRGGGSMAEGCWASHGVAAGCL